MIRILIGVLAASAAATAYAQQAPLNPSTPAGRLAVAGGAPAGTKVAPVAQTQAPGAIPQASANPPKGPAPTAKPPEQLTTAVTTKQVGKAKAPIKCADGERVKPGAKACSNRRGVDTAVLAAEAQPGEIAPAPAGGAPVTNALPSGELKPK